MQYVAFLRAINTTGRFVRMERLRRAFKAIGFAQVETYIQSGNILFESDSTDRSALENQIEYGLQGILGFPVPTFVRTGQEMLEISDQQPFADLDRGEDYTIYVIFVHAEPSLELQQALLERNNEVDRLKIYKNQIFWLYNRSQGESSLSNAKIEHILRVPATLRNMTTIHKIAEKYRK
jgi:uncharacterized protein (DUF1697 family)